MASSVPATGPSSESLTAPKAVRAVSPGRELQRRVRAVCFSDRLIGTVGRLWGRVGELYAALHYGVKLCRECAQGHDGRLGNDLVEIKTITSLKRKLYVRAKRSGNFSLLAVVRVLPDHRVDLRIVRRDRLLKCCEGKYLVLSWSRVCALADPIGCFPSVSESMLSPLQQTSVLF